MPIDKINGISFSSIDKFYGYAKGKIVKVSGIAAPSTYSSANSVFFDNTNDFATISGLTMTTDVGTVSFWLKLGQTQGTDVIFKWHNYSTSGAFTEFMDVRLQNNSGNPAARHIVFTYKGPSTGSGLACSMKTDSSNHGTGYSRWKYNTEDVTGFSSHERFEYNANRLTETGSHSFNPAEGAEHGWHHFAVTWDVNETYVGKDAQASHKFRPTASDDGTTTTHTGTMRIYMDGTLRNFGQSRYPSHNYQRTPEGMSEITSTLNEITVMARPNSTFHTAGNMDDLACHSVKLSDAAITAIYNSGTPIDLTSNSGDYTNSSNLTGYWKFDESSGTTIADSSTNSNDMTLVNGPTWDNGDAP